MAVSNDFSLDTTNRIIKHIAGTTVYTTNQLYSQIQDWMDDASYMDFTPPMSAQTPTDYQVINGWYLDEGLTNTGAANNCIEWLNGGAITTNGYNLVIYRLTFQAGGYTNAVAGDIGKIVANAGLTHEGTLLAYDNTNRIWWVRATLSVFTAEAVSMPNPPNNPAGTGVGTVTVVDTGEMAWPNIYTLGSIDTTGGLQQIYVVQNKVHVQIWGAAGTADPTPAASKHIDVLVKTKSVGVAIDSGNLTLFLRNYPAAGGAQVDLYDNFALTALTGRNAVPLATSADLNNTTATATVAAYAVKIVFVNGTITHGAITGTFTALESVSQAVSGATGIFISESAGVMTLGNVVGTFNNTNIITGGSSAATATSTGTLLLNNNTRVFPEAFTQDTAFNYSIIVECATLTLAKVYEYLKYFTRQTSVLQTYGLTSPDSLGVGTVAATINALNGEQYITTLVDTTTAANTYAAVKPSPFGTFAGGKFFGARGVWIQNMAASDVQAYQLIDSGGTTRIPPNQQSLTITNLVATTTGDAVGVFESQGASSTLIKKNQYLMTTQASGLGTITVGTAISATTPTTGYIRVVQASGAEQRYYYASWTGSTFTLGAKTDGYGTVLSTTTTQAYTVTVDTAYAPYLDDLYKATSASVTMKYTVDKNIVVNVRRYNGTAVAPDNSIIPFQTTGTFSSTGFSTPAIRTADTIVT